MNENPQQPTSEPAQRWEVLTQQVPNGPWLLLERNTTDPLNEFAPYILPSLRFRDSSGAFFRVEGGALVKAD